MSNLNKLTDDNLLELLKNDNKASFEELYNRYWAKLYSHAYKRVQKEEIAEEIVQDFFTSLWINRTRLSIAISFKSYTYAAVRNLVFKFYQKEYSHKKYQEVAKLQATECDYSTEHLIDYNDLVRTIEKEVETLSPKCQGVYRLSRNEYKSNKEIANILQISEKTVENHMTRALKVLRYSLKVIAYFLPFLQ